MSEETQSTAGETSTSEAEERSTRTITPELVNQVADKVYAMLMLDIKIEKERERFSYQSSNQRYGGRRCR